MEYSLDQDEPWLEGTIITNTLRQDRTSEDDLYIYFLFSGVQLGPGRALVGGNHYTKHRDGTNEDDVYMYLLFSGVQPGPGRALVGGDHYIKHIAPGRDERGRFVHVFSV